MLAGIVANRVLFQGQNLLSLKITMASILGFFILVIVGPLVMFTPHLARAKRKGLRTYGALASTYVDAFDAKWIDRGEDDESILGSADIQSLADLLNSYDGVKGMRLVPFSIADLSPLAVAVALPSLPLLLTIMPLDSLMTRMLMAVF